MRQSELFTRVERISPKDEEARSAKFLVRAGFINKEAAGVYSFLPLGLRVIRKIEGIVREAMSQVGGQEVLLPVLHPRDKWEKTGRWQSMDVLFKLKGREEREFALGPTHEEIIFPLLKRFVSSYKDLPTYVYQIQDKFRDEPRAKSGLLRGREFLMKDLYSFHADEADLGQYYDKMIGVYQNLFKAMGIQPVLTEASGGTFSKRSHEFQLLSEVGEDTIYYCEKCDWAENKEMAEVKTGTKCLKCGGKLEEKKAIEVGNIFKLNTRFSEPFEVMYKDEKGKENLVYAGCYGIGISRLMGAMAEVLSDEQGLVWPETVSPFGAHILELTGGSATKIYSDLQKKGIEVLYDDRKISAGEKFAEADLIGIPWRLVVSAKTGDKIEVKRRGEKESKLVKISEFIKMI